MTIKLFLFSLALVAYGHAHAHSGYEYLSYAREARQNLDLRARLAAVRALAGDPRPSAVITRETAGDGVNVEVAGTSLWWSERAGRFASSDPTAPLALARAILVDVPDRGPAHWDDAGATALLHELKTLVPRRRLPAAFWSAPVSADARAHYVEGGYPSALAVYAYALTESLEHADQRSLGRHEHLFGPEEHLNFNSLPKVVFDADDKTRVMNLLLTMLDIALPGGLHVVRRHGAIDDGARAAALGPRLHQLTAVLRQIRDTPAFVRACDHAPTEGALCTLTRTLGPLVTRLIGLDLHWRELDDRWEPVPAAMVDQFVSLGVEVTAAVAGSTYPGIARLNCGRNL